MASAKVAVRCSWADVVKGTSTTPEAASIDVVPLALSSHVDLDTSLDESLMLPLPEVVSQETIAPEMSCETPEVTTLMKPGVRGSQEYLCRGEVLSMLSHYGWLKPFSPIDHYSFWKHGGRIYVHGDDIVDGQLLSPGDIVTFHLYADSRGLGAEACRLEQRAVDVEMIKDGLRADATEFVLNCELDGLNAGSCLRADAVEFVPVSECQLGSAETSHPVASMFLRMSRTFESIYVNQYGQVAEVNSAYFDEDSSDDDDEAGDADRESCGDDSDHSSLDECIVSANNQANKFQEGITPKSKMRLLRSAAPWRKQKNAQDPCIEIATDSTSAGGTSASESESATFLKKRGLDLLTFCPPPGLSLPTEHEMPSGFFFPPGLA